MTLEVVGTPDIVLEGALIAMPADALDIHRGLAAAVRLGDKAGAKAIPPRRLLLRFLARTRLADEPYALSVDGCLAESCQAGDCVR